MASVEVAKYESEVLFSNFNIAKSCNVKSANRSFVFTNFVLLRLAVNLHTKQETATARVVALLVMMPSFSW